MRRAFARSVTHGTQPVLLLDFDAEPVEHELRVARPVHPVRPGIHAIDGDVHVQMIGVVMYDTHALVLREPEGLACAALDRRKYFAGRFFARRKCQDQVIRAVSRAVIPDLNALDLENRAGDVGADAVGQPDSAQPLRVTATAREVSHEPAEAAAGSRHRDLLRDHGSPRSRSAR